MFRVWTKVFWKRGLIWVLTRYLLLFKQIQRFFWIEVKLLLWMFQILLCVSFSLLTMCQKQGKVKISTLRKFKREGMGKLGRDLWLVAENFKVISPLRPIWAWDCAKYSFIIKLDSFLQVLSRKSRGWGRHLNRFVIKK